MQIPFVGPSYEGISKSISAERSINLYVEKTETPEGKTKFSLIGCGGKRKWFQLPKFGIRGCWVVPGNELGVGDRLFVVAANKVYEVFSGGTYTEIGTLQTLYGHVGMCNNPTQLMITDNAYIYTYTLKPHTYTIYGIDNITIPAGTIVSTDTSANTTTVRVLGGVFTLSVNNTTTDQGNENSPIIGKTCTFMDSYFVTHKDGTNSFGLSNNNNGLSWDPLDVAAKEGSPDAIVAVQMWHRNLILFGQYNSELWYDSGTSTFPLAPIQGVYMETGCAAPFSVVNADNTVYWVGYEKKGWGMVYKMNGYLPQRISTHAIEKIINDTGSAPYINAYAYQEEGHCFYVINAPNLGTTLVYDAATQLWHERCSIDFTGNLNRDRVGYHAFAFGHHILFDYQTNDVYIGELGCYVDGDKPLRRIRVSPHLYKDLNYVFFRNLQIDMETGVGTDGDECPNPRAILKLSNDGGYTYGSEQYCPLGKIGKKRTRVRFNNLGMARDRVFWFEVSEPVKVVLLGAELDALEGTM